MLEKEEEQVQSLFSPPSFTSHFICISLQSSSKCIKTRYYMHALNINYYSTTIIPQLSITTFATIYLSTVGIVLMFYVGTIYRHYKQYTLTIY